MLVKKIRDSWQPSENPSLAVGKTLEVTNPKELIINGDAVGIDENGMELSAFDLYGEIIQSELDEFRQWKAMQKQEALAAKLEEENKELIKEVAKKSAEKEVAKKEAKIVEDKKTSETPTEDKSVDEMSWKELTTFGKEKGVYKVGMKKVELIKALKNV